MDDLSLGIARLLVTFFGWVFVVSAIVLLADRVFQVRRGPLFWGLSFLGFGIAWFRADGQGPVRRALIRAGARPRRVLGYWWFWDLPRRLAATSLAPGPSKSRVAVPPTTAAGVAEVA